MFELILNRLRDKRILVLGFGREGESTLRFLNKYLPDAVVAVADKQAKEGVDYAGDNYLEAIYNYDIVIKTPGISLKDFDTKGVEITSQTDLFLSHFHIQTIGITGTKGKSTTTCLIHHLLSESGRDAILTGNIGIPCFDIMEDIKPESIVVYELSAHQLEYVHNSPRVGVLLNVFEEHLDHFGSMERYKSAKLNILRFLEDEGTAVVKKDLLNDVMAIKANYAVIDEFNLDGLVKIDALPLKGEHNLFNVKAALLACEKYGVDYHDLIQYLYTFKPLEHRLEPVGVFGGVSFVNDSISTIPQATIAACKTLENMLEVKLVENDEVIPLGKVDFLLLGGMDRGIDYTPLVDFLKDSSVPHLLFTGKAGERMMKLLKDNGLVSNLQPYTTMEDAFAYLSAHAKNGDVCLLSPAASSYDQYKNFIERGRKFKDLAQQFGK